MRYCPLRPGTLWLAGLFGLLAVAPLGGSEPESGTIEGRVISPDGGPFVGATIRLIAPGGSEQVVRTDSNGEYRFDGLRHGFFYVSATCQSCSTIEQPRVELPPGSTEHVNFVLERQYWRLKSPQLRPCDSLSTLRGQTREFRWRRLQALDLDDTSTEAGALVLRMTSLPEVEPEYSVSVYLPDAGPARVVVREAAESVYWANYKDPRGITDEPAEVEIRTRMADLDRSIAEKLAVIWRRATSRVQYGPQFFSFPLHVPTVLFLARSESGWMCGQLKHHGRDTGPGMLLTIGSGLHSLAERPEDWDSHLDSFLLELIVRAEKHYPPETAD